MQWYWVFSSSWILTAIWPLLLLITSSFVKPAIWKIYLCKFVCEVQQLWPRTLMLVLLLILFTRVCSRQRCHVAFVPCDWLLNGFSHFLSDIFGLYLVYNNKILKIFSCFHEIYYWNWLLGSGNSLKWSSGLNVSGYVVYCKIAWCSNVS